MFFSTHAIPFLGRDMTMLMTICFRLSSPGWEIENKERRIIRKTIVEADLQLLLAEAHHCEAILYSDTNHFIFVEKDGRI